MNKELRVKCPQCALAFSYYESEFRPFCSEKCRLIDLGHWFKESYTVPVKDNSKVGAEIENIKNENADADAEKESTAITQEIDEDEYNESDYH
jgi:endogenous inhibitor of DNA gyrase (YacG/DUF329 family)